jgi:hypothetical protein
VAVAGGAVFHVRCHVKAAGASTQAEFVVILWLVHLCCKQPDLIVSQFYFPLWRLN